MKGFYKILSALCAATVLLVLPMTTGCSVSGTSGTPDTVTDTRDITETPSGSEPDCDSGRPCPRGHGHMPGFRGTDPSGPPAPIPHPGPSLPGFGKGKDKMPVPLPAPDANESADGQTAPMPAPEPRSGEDAKGERPPRRPDRRRGNGEKQREKDSSSPKPRPRKRQNPDK